METKRFQKTDDPGVLTDTRPQGATDFDNIAQIEVFTEDAQNGRQCMRTGRPSVARVMLQDREKSHVQYELHLAQIALDALLADARQARVTIVDKR